MSVIDRHTVPANADCIEKHSIPKDEHICIIDSLTDNSKTLSKDNNMKAHNHKYILEWEQIKKEDDALLRKNRNRIHLLTKILSQPVLDLSILREACWCGVPQSMRATIWKILLGYLPHKLSRRQSTLARKRAEYFDLIERYYVAIDDEHRSTQEKEALIQIEKDVDRMNHIFQIPKIQNILTRALYIWSLKHTATGYVQGIHDLITPFLYIFLCEYIDDMYINHVDINILSGAIDEQLTANDLLRIEADSFWCLDYLMEGLQVNYIDNQPGITSMLQQLEHVIYRMNLKLYQHLKAKGVEFFQFAYRWMNCLLMRELSLRQIIRLWDTYLCEGVTTSCIFTEFHVFVCASLLLTFHETLIKMEFDEIVLFLQDLKYETSHWSEREIEMILSQAFVYQQMFGKSKKSLF